MSTDTATKGAIDLNKMELINKVAERAELKKKDAEAAVNAVFDIIAEALKDGDKVQVIGFGTFETRERSARSGRNPQTGETISIPASVVPAFKPGNRLKEVIR
ncbi:HU family DNA-binding protein [Alicyclobacillus kakegawensis]|uniref:HU family DNA-binding protein n=1 Tax=Alicyclobacillus TaxID=29330 RepID=UPI003F71A7CE|nr:HU family DNA-binding protein [Alicyclobacillus shizuokensis]